MKKLLIALIVGFCALTVGAQNANRSNTSTEVDATVPYNLARWIWTMKVPVNSLSVADSTWTYTVYKESKNAVKYDVFIVCDSIGGTKNNVKIIVQGKKFLQQPSWTDLKTVWWTTGKDTTKTITESTTAQQYPYYRVFVQGVDNTFLARFTYLGIKFWE